MTEAQGKVYSVETYPSGTTVLADYAIGATVLEVGSVLDLQETGGQLVIEGNVYDYTLDSEAALITLPVPLTTAVEDGAVLLVTPPSEEKRAFIFVDENEDAVIALVPHSLQGDFDEGIREDLERETVVLEEVRGQWVIKDVVALEPLTEIRLTQAFEAALEAQEIADVALASANGKNKTYYSTSAPGTTENVSGDLWFQRDPAVPQNVIAMWVGTGGTTWVNSPITNSVIAYLDAAKITTGYLDVANRVAAGSITTPLLAARSIGAEQIALGAISTNMIADPSFEDVYPLASWGPSQNHHWSIRQQMAAAGNTADLYRISTPGPRSGRGAIGMSCKGPGLGDDTVAITSNVIPVVPGEKWTMRAYFARWETTGDADVYIRLAGGSTMALTEFPATSAASRIPWTDEDPNLGENMHVIGFGARPLPEEYTEFSANITIPAGVNYVSVYLRNSRFNETHDCTVYFDDISFTKQGQGATEITPAGVRLFDKDGSEMAAMVSNRPNVFSVTKEGATLASMSDAGQVSGRTMSVGGVDVDGDGVIDKGLEIFGTEFLEWLDQFPRGIVAWENFNLDTTGLVTECGYGEIGFLAQPGRLYRINVRSMIEANTVAESIVTRLRMTYAADPTPAPDPKVTSPVLLQTNVVPTAANGAGDADFYFSDFALLYNESATPRNVRVLLTMDSGGATYTPVIRAQGNGVSSITDPESGCILAAEDVGPYRAQGGGYNAGGASAPTAPPIQTYTKTFTSTSAKSYMGNGSQDSSQGVSDMKQGYSSADGDSKSLWIFPSMTATLAGATITKIRVYLYANHWYYNAGGTARVKVHGYSSAPGSSPSMTTALDSTSWPKPGGRWVTLPSSLHAGFISGAYRGVGVGPAGSTSQTYYGRFNRDGAKIEITYKK